MAPDAFFRLFGGKPSDMVTRIEFEHIEARDADAPLPTRGVE